MRSLSSSAARVSNTEGTSADEEVVGAAEFRCSSTGREEDGTAAGLGADIVCGIGEDEMYENEGQKL